MSGGILSVNADELLDHLDRRFTENERVQSLRYADLVRRIDKTSGGLSRHDGILIGLQNRVRELSEQYDRFMNRVGGVVASQVHTSMDSLRREFQSLSTAKLTTEPMVSWSNLKTVGILILGTVGATVAFLTAMGLLHLKGTP